MGANVSHGIPRMVDHGHSNQPHDRTPQTNGKYRSKEAQDVHTKIIGYIKDRVNEKDLANTINNLAIDLLKETSSNGNTHLSDAVHLSFEMTNNESTKKCTTLIRLLCARARSLGGNTLSFLLTTQNVDGFTPLHSALKSGNADNMRAYFDEVHQALESGVISKDQYRSLLTSPTSAGFTPLHEALKSGNADNMRAYFAEVRKALESGILSKDQYRSLLTSSNRAGFTPLHHAAASGNLELILFFLNVLEKDLDSNEFTRALHQKMSNGYSPSCPSNKEVNSLLDTMRRDHPLVSEGQRGEKRPYDSRGSRSSYRDSGDQSVRHRNERNRSNARDDKYRKRSNQNDYIMDDRSLKKPKTTRELHSADFDNEKQDFKDLYLLF